MSCAVNVKVVTNLKTPSHVKSNIIPVIAWRRAISPPENTILLRKVCPLVEYCSVVQLEEVTEGVFDPIIAVSWSTILSVYLIKVKSKQIVSPNRDLEFVPIAEYRTLHPIKAMKWIGRLLVLVLTPSLGGITDEITVYDPFKKEELEEREINDSLVFHLRYAAPYKQKELATQAETNQQSAQPVVQESKKVCYSSSSRLILEARKDSILLCISAFCIYA